MALAVFLAGCGSGPTGGVKEALIGGNLELSGESAEWGQDTKKGMELACEEVNARPEQKVKLRIVYVDNRSEPGWSKNAMKQLIAQDGVLAVIGAVGSNRTIAASDVAMEEKVPLMTHASTNVTITRKGEYISRICFNDDFQGPVMARFARATLKAETVVIMVSRGNTYSEGLSVSFRKVFTALGGKILDELAYQAGTKDFKTHATTLKQLNPDVVWLPGYHNEAGLIVKQAREAGFQAPFLGVDGWDAPALFQLAGPAIKGNFVCNHFDAGDPDPVVQEFARKFEARYKSRPTAMAALGYDAVYAMADAVNRARELKPEALKDAINTLKDLKGVCGTITMGPDREVVKNAVVLETGETGFKYKETIKP
ncbi:MAG: ABC transporter substrate-binding protein [Planctomycetota bacterium]